MTATHRKFNTFGTGIHGSFISSMITIAAMVLEQGRIMERGSHDELIAQHGRYYQLYTGQAELS